MGRHVIELAILVAVVWLAGSILLVGCSSEPSGAELYALHCASCHGAAGQGGIAAPLGTPGYLVAHDDAMIIRTVREGKSSAGMRAFGRAQGGELSDVQIDAIVQYLRSTPSSH